LSFENIVKNELRHELSEAGYKYNYKDRVHMSRAKMDMYGNVDYLKVGEFKVIKYFDDTSTRYIAAPNLTFDTLVSIYDVNTRNTLVCRIFKFGDIVKREGTKFVDSLKKDRPNLEARIIGMQTNQDFYFVLNQVLDFLLEKKIRLVEIDLFGENTRHIAIDTKLGTSYNVLMEDRVYRPGELVNNMTVENFERTFRPGDILPVHKDILLKKDMPKAPKKRKETKKKEQNPSNG
jgi:hypothetical protein